ncbi:MAG: TonB-dependent receptor [Vicinamibacterales bacterium]
MAWEQRLAPRLQLSGSLFENDVSELITQVRGADDTLDGLYYGNSDRVTARGVEVELQGELPGRARARLAQVYQSAAFVSGRRISNSPRTISTVVVDVPVGRTETVLGFNGHYVGERRSVTAGVVPGAFVGNLSLSRRAARRGLGIGVTIYNVFNASYGDPGSVEHRQDVLPQDGRTALARLSWRF